ncbi:MAG: hypothetical protein KatS3mg064_0381 [Tepidiforma sp.]|jgi:hypothetical protein|nr:MAG: hypothetical protein KatS3mg064_0381 [Tepidiforma sp.]
MTRRLVTLAISVSALAVIALAGAAPYQSW